MESVHYHSKTLWLFTLSDVKTIIVPSTFFGVTNALASSAYGFHSKIVNQVGAVFTVPIVSFWVWIHLLPFAINNQAQNESIQEDQINKPWRPLPSGRITSHNALRIMFVFYAVSLISSFILGGYRQSLSLIFLGTWYNNFGGADRGLIIRNLINALGYICFTSGAMEVAQKSYLPLTWPLAR